MVGSFSPRHSIIMYGILVWNIRSPFLTPPATSGFFLTKSRDFLSILWVKKSVSFFMCSESSLISFFRLLLRYSSTSFDSRSIFLSSREFPKNIVSVQHQKQSQFDLFVPGESRVPQ